LVHCGRGHDRTGIVACVLLALVGVEPEEIADDYERSDANMPPDQQRALRDILARERTTCREVILDLLTRFDIEACVRGGGLTDRDIAALRTRLIE
jgi:protein tyrosine/serine phosphatase